MQFHILTIFPAFFSSALSIGLLKKARDKGIVSCVVHDLRDYTSDRHRSTDDVPYGGGPGMVMKPEPLVRALEDVCRSLVRPCRILLSPQGALVRQPRVRELSRETALVLLCGRYEGIDERVRAFVDEELSVGDYVLSGGECAALVLIDAVARLVPGVVGRKESVDEESFSNGILEYPQYTRPEEFRGQYVPEILRSGNHAKIAAWRRRAALLRTAERRPDLLRQASLTGDEKRWLAEVTGRGKTEH